MARARREANKVRKEIVEGIFDYAEFQAQMADEAAKRRKEDDRRRSEARCGTVCTDIPREFLAYMRPWALGLTRNDDTRQPLALN